MSTLIDNLINQTGVNQQVGHYWYIAKPYEGFYLKKRIKDAWRILTGKSRAYHYKEDEDCE
jgi:hypothetical protein